MKIKQYRRIPVGSFHNNDHPGVEFDVTTRSGTGHAAAIIVWGEENSEDAIKLFEALGAVAHVGCGVPLEEGQNR